MKRILIAIDYTPTSGKVTQKGHELAKLAGAEICLIHVISDVHFYGMEYSGFMGYEGYAFPQDYKLQDESIKVAENFLKITAGHLTDVSVSTHLAEGDTANAVLDYADTWGATLIVMGTHSHSVLEKILMGTVASSVLEKTKIPVLMVPTK